MIPFLAWVFRRWLARLAYFNVGDGSGDTFFCRYDLLKTTLWGSVYLHEFFRSDKDLCLHDHPWPFVTVILRGGYWEHVFTGVADPETGERRTERRWRRPGYIGVYRAEHAHRIEIDPARPRPWSLVFVGPKSRPWGFWTIHGRRAWAKGQPNPICETK